MQQYFCSITSTVKLFGTRSYSPKNIFCLVQKYSFWKSLRAATLRGNFSCMLYAVTSRISFLCFRLLTGVVVLYLISLGQHCTFPWINNGVFLVPCCWICVTVKVKNLWDEVTRERVSILRLFCAVLLQDLVKKVNTIQCRADVWYWKPRRQFNVYQSRQRRGAKANRINTFHGKHLSSFVLFPSANIWCSGCVWESDPPGKEINDASQSCCREREHHLECQVLIEIHMFHSEEYQYVLVHNA